MAFFDWIPKGPEHAYQAEHAVRPIWKGSPYTDKASGYTLQACLGMSDKGYHGGLTVTPPGGEAKTTWRMPMARRDEAMEQSFGALVDWVDRNEARQRGIVDGKLKRPTPSWER